MCRACQREQTVRDGFSEQPIRLKRAKHPLTDQWLHQGPDAAGAVAGAELQHAELGVLGVGIHSRIAVWIQ